MRRFSICRIAELHSAKGQNLLGLSEVTCASGPVVSSAVSFTALGGLDYLVAVDGTNGAQGIIHLNWRLGVPPTITGHPASQLVRLGSNAIFSVSAGGVLAPVIHWQLKDTNAVRFGERVRRARTGRRPGDPSIGPKDSPFDVPLPSQKAIGGTPMAATETVALPIFNR